MRPEWLLPDAATAATLTALLVCLASFAWAMVRFFTRPGGSRTGIGLVKLLGTGFGFLSCAALLLLGAASPAHAAASLLVSGLSLALFWWAIDANRRQPLSFAFSHDLPRHLNRAGPYRRIRHPLYTAYLLAWLSAPIATGEPLLLLPFSVMAVIYHAAARLEERKFEASPLGERYAAYRSTAGMFWPAVSCLRPGSRPDATTTLSGATGKKKPPRGRLQMHRGENTRPLSHCPPPSDRGGR